MSLLLRCRSMRHTRYTWFRTHTTLVTLFVVQIRFRVEAHLVEQFESELGVVLVVFKQDIPYVRFVI